MFLDILHPGWWWALPLVGVPLAIHLLARARPPVYLFASVQFLRRVMQRIRRVRKPKDLLLLALRTVLLAAVLGVFLQPRWFRLKPGGGAGAPRVLVVIVDASASMAWREGAQSRFAAACGEADEVLRGLRTGDRANLLWMRSPTRAEWPEPGVNLAYLRDRLRAGEVSSEAGDPAEALRLAVAQLRGLPGRHELCIISDFQQSAWSTRPDLPPEVAVTMVSVAHEAAANLAITRFDARPARPLVGEDVFWSAEVQNFSPQAVRTEVRFEADEAREVQEVALVPWGRASVTFRALAVQAGPRTATVTLGDDAFPDDNRAASAVLAWPSLRTGLWATNATEAGSWRRALRAIPWVEVVPLGSELGAVSACDALVLCGWDGASPAAVRGALAAGRPVLWQPAHGTPVSAILALVGGTSASASSSACVWDLPRAPVPLAVAEPADPALALFASGDFGDLTTLRFSGRLVLPDLAEQHGTVILRYADGPAALMRIPVGAGQLALWNLTLDPRSGPLAARAEFIPLVGELLLSCRGEGGRVATLEPGQDLVLAPEGPALARELTVTGPAGPAAVERREMEGSPLFSAGRALQPGVYTWRRGDEVLAVTAVHFPAVESDLRTLEPGDAKRGWVAASGGASLRALREGRPLWPLLLALAALAGLLESAVAWGIRRS